MLQGKVEDKDREIQRLKYELQQKRSEEDDKTDAPPKNKDSDDVISGEAVN